MRDALAAAWCADDRQLAERFSRAMTAARSELGRGVTFTAVLKKAWAIDPGLRGQFGAAVSAGLRKMWRSEGLRAEQSARIKRSYTEDLRRQRSEVARKRWAAARAVPADDCDLRRRREMS